MTIVATSEHYSNLAKVSFQNLGECWDKRKSRREKKASKLCVLKFKSTYKYSQDGVSSVPILISFAERG